MIGGIGPSGLISGMMSEEWRVTLEGDVEGSVLISKSIWKAPGFCFLVGFPCCIVFI